MSERGPQTPGKPYRPSNGAEGAIFDDGWCARCKRDAKYRETMDGKDSCPILSDVMVYEIGDEKYPKEWIVGEDGWGICTAFDQQRGEEER